MKHPLKIIIKQLGPTRGDWMRYRTVDKIMIEKNSALQTEAQFAWYIYSRFGEGRYMCLCWQKGIEAFWLYWIGNLYPNGFIRDIRRDKEVERLKKDFVKADSYQEKEMIQEDIQFTREINTSLKSSQRTPCKGLIKFRAGILHAYDEPIPR